MPGGRWRRNEGRFRALHAERRAAYAAACDVQVDGEPEARVVAASIDVAPIVRPDALDVVPRLVGDRRAVLLVDDAVAGRAPALDAETVVIAGGEQAKATAQLEVLWRGLAAAELERRDVVVAMGGGAVTDVAGFAAATSGGAGVDRRAHDAGRAGGRRDRRQDGDRRGGKNDVGAFHLPRPCRRPGVLGTLPAREWAAGFAEVVKTALLAGGRLGSWSAAGTPARGITARTELVRLAAAYKARVVGEDPTEQGLRAVLNLGHTIGHGVEAAAGYGELLHGEAVAIGLLAALRLSARAPRPGRGGLAETERILVRAGLPTRATGSDAGAVRRRCAETRSGPAVVPGWCCSTRSDRRCSASTLGTTR